MANDYNSAKSELCLNKVKRESTLYCKGRNFCGKKLSRFFASLVEIREE